MPKVSFRRPGGIVITQDRGAPRSLVDAAEAGCAGGSRRASATATLRVRARQRGSASSLLSSGDVLEEGRHGLLVGLLRLLTDSPSRAEDFFFFLDVY